MAARRLVAYEAVNSKDVRTIMRSIDENFHFNWAVGVRYLAVSQTLIIEIESDVPEDHEERLEEFLDLPEMRAILQPTVWNRIWSWITA